MSRRAALWLLPALVLALPAISHAQDAPPPAPGVFPPPHGEARDDDAARENDAAREDEAAGPTDPGPYPRMPGYFTKRARELNYRETPFFGGGRYGVWPHAGGYAGTPDYYPPVYPYYDGSYHYQWYLAREREKKIKNRSERLRGEGLEALKAGDYETAVIRLLGAAEFDQGDPAARIHAGHALFALGRYDDAAFLLRRGIELQPSLIYERFDPGEDFGRRDDFDFRLETLRRHVEQSPHSPGALIVLGYMTYYVDGPTKARPIVERAAELAPRDSLVIRLCSVVTRATVDEAVARSARQDLRPYDAMGLRPQFKPTYDALRRVRAPTSPPRRHDAVEARLRLRRA